MRQLGWRSRGASSAEPQAPPTSKKAACTARPRYTSAEPSTPWPSKRTSQPRPGLLKRSPKRGDPLEEGLGHVPIAGLAAAHQRLEGVAAQQLVVELGVLRRPRDEVEADHPRAVQHQDAALTVDQREGGEQPVEIALSALVGVAHGARAGVRAVLAVQPLDLRPHGALVGVRGRAAAHRRVGAGPHREPDLPLRQDLALGELP